MRTTVLGTLYTVCARCADDGIQRIGTGDGGQALRLLDAGAMQDVRRQDFAFDGAAAKVGRQVLESIGLLVDHRHVMSRWYSP